jgi:hypothetical protein
LHHIIEKAQNIDDWKDIIFIILNENEGIFYMPNKFGDTPETIDSENRFGIAAIIAERSRLKQKPFEKKPLSESTKIDNPKLKKSSKSHITNSGLKEDSKAVIKVDEEKLKETQKEIEHEKLIEIPATAQLNRKVQGKQIEQPDSKEKPKDKKQKGPKANKKSNQKQPQNQKLIENNKQDDYRDKLKEALGSKTTKSKTIKESEKQIRVTQVPNMMQTVNPQRADNLQLEDYKQKLQHALEEPLGAKNKNKTKPHSPNAQIMMQMNVGPRPDHESKN